MRNLKAVSVAPVLVYSILLSLAGQPAHGGFTRLEEFPVKLAGSAVPYPGGRHEAANLVDGNPRTEYSSDSKGPNTWVEFDFGAPTAVAAFRHVDRNDPATLAGSELQILDGAGTVVTNLAIAHPNRRSGAVLATFNPPVTGQRARWQVTRLGANYGTVGGAEITFFKAGQVETDPNGISAQITPQLILERSNDGPVRPVSLALNYPYLEAAEGKLLMDGTEPHNVQLKPGVLNLDLKLKAGAATSACRASLEIGGKTVLSRTFELKPVPPLDIYLLPHSHVDIGYTALQADVEQKQNTNMETGLRLARETAAYPEGARFKWNVEVLWPVENYLRAASPEKKAAFLKAVRSGQVGLEAFYGNILTGLCRPEELIRLTSYATRLADLCGVTINSAMISDVPGYTWSTVSAMAHAGVKYFSFAPNYFDRMGGTMKEWQNRPFWWEGPDGKSRVLCWCPSRGYALGHLIGDGEALSRFMPAYVEELATNNYPYAITHLRWNVHGDNGSPDEKVADVVRDWDATHISPRLILSTTSEAFKAFEARYGDKLPVFRGDYTPYWEDGAASSAAETALNRASAERLVQAETLWAMRKPGPFPAEAFQDAWRNVLLYSEHTWGAHNSISQPDIPFVKDQWKVKQAFALDADKQSRALLARALDTFQGADARAGFVDVFNTASWPRTDLVTLSPELSAPGDSVVDERGSLIPSQRLSTGELVFVASDLKPFSSRRYRVVAGTAPKLGKIRVAGGTLESPDYTVHIDPKSGAIQSLFSRRLQRELVDPKAATALNDYYYLPGSDLKGLQRNGAPRVTVKEQGAVLVSLLVESDAPGCKQLRREIRLLAGLDRVEIIDTIDKLPVRAKEGVHLGFGFNVPGGQARMDVGWAQVRPELDQIPAACKNWFSVQRWVDVSNDKFGVTLSPIDSPLIELGGITANLVGSQNDWRVWIQHLEPSQTIYAWVMNNHWHTNYRADQEGPTVFRFAIRAHKGFAPEEAARFGANCSQPLLAARAASGPATAAALKLSSDKVVVTAFKPSDDGRAQIVRLFGASGKAQQVKLVWTKPAPKRLWLSNTSEKPLQALGDSVEVPAWGIVTIRAE